jgi:hypothetical protein
MKKVTLFYLFLILFLTVFTISFNYVEGDDASTILYHLVGRDLNLQEPYAKYNSGFDYLLSFIDNNSEDKLKKFAYIVSFSFSVAILFLFVLLFNKISLIKNQKLNYSFFIFLPLIMPEILFNSLVINSSNISYFFSILALLFFLKSLTSKYLLSYLNIYFLFSIICFAIAIPFRWSIIMFLPMFFCFHYFLFNHNLIKIVKINLIHITISLLIGLLLINLTGYTLEDFINTIIWGKKYSDGKEVSFLGFFATGLAFLSPIVIILLILGIVKFIFIEKFTLNKIFLFFIPLIPFCILGFFPSYKFIFPIIPLVIYLLYIGYDHIFRSYKNLTLIFMILGVFSMWFIGIEIDNKQYAYGTSFCFKSKKEITEDYSSTDSKKSFCLDFNGGTYMPTLEGGRPLFGFFYVFKNQWKNTVINQQLVLDSIVKSLDSDNSLKIIQDRKTAFLQSTFYKYGYKTQMKFKDFNDELIYRDFYKKNKLIRLYVIKDNTKRSRIQIAHELLSSNEKVIFRSSYTSLIRDVYNENNIGKNFWDVFTLTNF